MSTDPSIDDCIDAAADAVGPVWPLHSFVPANPLAGSEDRPFHEAVAAAERTLGGRGYPTPEVFRRALAGGRIDRETLAEGLSRHGYDDDPDASLDQLAAAESAEPTDGATTATDRVDAVVSKWLSAFLDQGRAAWPMPNRERGFYAAVRVVAPHDGDVPDGERFADLPDRPLDAIRAALEGDAADRYREIFEFQLSALPGWTGFLKRRAADGGDWQAAHPVTLRGYLAVRLTLADLFDAPVAPPEAPDAADEDDVPLPEVWLRAWEATYREDLVGAVADASAAADDGSEDGRPDAQLVFCIDARSEVLRRHVEAAGRYETHGYAGFFGVPMRYAGHGAETTTDACPPILDARHRIAERPPGGADAEPAAYGRWHAAREAAADAVERVRSNAATAFSFVEGTGAGYGAALAARTLVPRRVRALLDAVEDRVPDAHEFTEPSIDYNPDSVHDLREGLTLAEKVEYAATAFELMGIERFAPVVAVVGHASRTTNNPFDSALDCGACAGNPGGPNARVLAAICNDDAVRAALRDRGIDVPEDTVFVAGEHDTATDAVELYDDEVPESHADALADLRADLETARAGAAAERADDLGADGVRGIERRAADWAETRPEWGLAGNASLVVGPRALTDGLDLDGRAFLHSYDWTTDPEGEALASILTGPLVVAQWINAQYYFASVDTAAYGSGSKVTQNPVGNVGVYQGNGGDLLTGLPRESVAAADGALYHQPLRLSAVVHAPVERVTDVLAAHESVTDLLDNGWLSLSVVDPQDHRPFHYAGDLEWTPAGTRSAPEAAPAPAAADD